MEQRKKFRLADVVLSVICVVFVAEAAAPVASIGNSQYFWWVFMMIAFLLPYGMISSELGTTYTGDGGLYDWINKAFPRAKWGARASWYYWINFPLWMASLAVVCPELLSVLTGLQFGWLAKLLIELAFIWIVTWIAFYPVCDSILILNISAAIKMILALTVGVLGIVYVVKNGFVNDMAFRTFLPGFDLHSLSYISVIIFNFLGFEVVCTYADNMRDPKRQIPQAIITGGIVIALIYLFSAFGIGAATKWTCLYAGAGLGVLWALHWVFSGVRAHRAGDGRRYARRLLGNIGFCLVFFVLVPGMIYYASYYPYGAARGLHGAGMYFTREYAAIVLENQRFMFTYHAGLVATHPYSSRWWQWLLDLRPILYYLSYGDGTVSTIGAFVNPLLCWGGLLALPVLAYRAWKCDRTALFILVGYLAQVLPWVFISRLTFEYHYFAATLFLVLALGYVFDRLRRHGYLGIVYAFTAANGVLFALFYPVLTGVTIPRDYAWNVLKWLPDWPF